MPRPGGARRLVGAPAQQNRPGQEGSLPVKPQDAQVPAIVVSSFLSAAATTRPSESSHDVEAQARCLTGGKFSGR